MTLLPLFLRQWYRCDSWVYGLFRWAEDVVSVLCHISKSGRIDHAELDGVVILPWCCKDPC